MGERRKKNLEVESSLATMEPSKEKVRGEIWKEKKIGREKSSLGGSWVSNWALRAPALPSRHGGEELNFCQKCFFIMNFSSEHAQCRGVIMGCDTRNYHMATDQSDCLISGTYIIMCFLLSSL